MPLAPIVVWPHAKVWGARDLFPALEPLEALLDVHSVDMHAVGYLLPDVADGQPRIKIEQLPELIATGREPLMWWVFVDVDNPRHALHVGDPSNRIKELFARAPHSALQSAGVYTTQAGFRLLWRLAVPIPVGQYRAFMEAFLAQLSKQTGLPYAAEAGPLGGLDPTCTQWYRCYRLPYVVRDGKPTQPALIDFGRCLRMPLDWRPREPLTRDALPQVAPADAPPCPLSADDVPHEHWQALADHRNGASAKCYAAAYDGTPLAKRGDRDNTMIRAINEVFDALGSATAIDPWNILARSIAADASDGAPTLAKLWERCQHFARARQRDLASRALARVQPPIVFTQKGRYYVLNETTGSYMPPVAPVALVHGLEHYAPTMGLLTRSNSNKPRDTAELLADYGQPARNIIVVLGTATTTYEQDTGTLYEAACATRHPDPIFHPEVDVWLSLLGGDGAGGSGPLLAERFKAWLATLTQLDDPTCALYLEGPPSIGKGMLAAGLSSLWGDEGATSYDDAIGAFNDALTRCPLVHVDESVNAETRRFGNGGWTASFRTLTGDSTRPLHRKYADAATLQGCPRLLITANNADALKIRERLTAEDIAAIAMRILHIRAADTAKQWLINIGGRAATRDWVQGAGRKPGKIAEHVAWLTANHPMTPGSRFLVEGVLSDYHRDLAANHGIASAVLATLAHCAIRKQHPTGIEFGRVDEPGMVCVNMQVLRKQWTVLTSELPPSESVLAGALGALADGPSVTKQVSTGRMRIWRIPVSSILRVATLLQIGDPDTLPVLLSQHVAMTQPGPNQ